MEQIMSYLSEMLWELIGTICIVSILGILTQKDQVLYNMIYNFFVSVCG